jgi:hypothetical protein
MISVVVAKAVGKTAKASHVLKEVGIVSGGLSAPLWLQYVETFNTLIASLVGLCTLVYVFIRAKKALKGEV